MKQAIQAQIEDSKRFLAFLRARLHQAELDRDTGQATRHRRLIDQEAYLVSKLQNILDGVNTLS